MAFSCFMSKSNNAFFGASNAVSCSFSASSFVNNVTYSGIASFAVSVFLRMSSLICGVILYVGRLIINHISLANRKGQPLI